MGSRHEGAGEHRSWRCRDCRADDDGPWAPDRITGYFPAHDPYDQCNGCGCYPPHPEREIAALNQLTLATLESKKRATNDAAAPPAPAPAETCGVAEAALLLNTTPDGVYALRARGSLPASIGPGRRLLWLRKDLLDYAARAASPRSRR
jgi:hypothetical protein